MNPKTWASVLLSVFVILCLPGGSIADGFDDSQIKHIVYPDWFNENPFSDLSEELDTARSGGKQGLMVLFTTEGCSYCHLFVRKSLGDPALASLVQQHFESAGLEIFDDTEMTDPRGVSIPIKEFAVREGAEFAPTLLFYDLDGERILKVVGYQSPDRFRAILDYLSGQHYRTQSLREYFARRAEAEEERTERIVVALREDPLFGKPPYVLDRSATPAKRPLLVIFEKADSPECENFHTEVLARDEVRDVLTQFEVMRFDAADDKTSLVGPDGGMVTPASWFVQTEFTRVPALMFFNEEGITVLQTDALVLQQRMMNSLNYVLERAYERGWSYQRFARSQAIARQQTEQKGR